MTWYVTGVDEGKTERWLRELGGYRAVPEALAILTRCVRKAEVEFAVAFIKAPGWFMYDGDTFANQHLLLIPRARLGDFSVSFVLRSRHEDWSWAIDIVADRVPGRNRPVDPRREESIQASVTQYRVVEQAHAPAVAKHINGQLEAHARRVRQYTLERFQNLVAPGLVWVPLGERFELFNMPYRSRWQPLAHWLREHGHELPGERLALLAGCQWYGTVEFLLPILLEGSWKIKGRRAMNGSVGVAVRPYVNKHEVDFLVGRLESKTQPPTVVEVLKPSSPYRPSERWHEQRRRDAVEEAGYKYLPIDAAKAAEEGRWWAQTLQELISEREVRAERVHSNPRSKGPGTADPDLRR
ncbi:MAG: hypothetical protein ABR499_00835 [Gemmatimonadaceae bacterium]